MMFDFDFEEWLEEEANVCPGKALKEERRKVAKLVTGILATCRRAFPVSPTCSLAAQISRGRFAQLLLFEHHDHWLINTRLMNRRGQRLAVIRHLECLRIQHFAL